MREIFTLLATQINKNEVSIPKAAADQAQLNGIFTAVLGIAGAICVLFIIIGGLRYVTSQGNADAVRAGREMIIYSIVGLVVVMMSFLIVQLVLGVINQT